MTILNLVVNHEEKIALVIDPTDNVAVLLTDIQQGEKCSIRIEDRVEMIVAKEDISFGHKIALKSFNKDEPVKKYGEEIGKVKEAVEQGGWIHNHNMYCERGM